MRWHLFIFFCIPVALSAQNVGVNIDSPLFHLDVRAPSPGQNTLLNIASPDNAYFTRLLAGHSGFPNSSLSWATGTPFIFGMWDGTTYTGILRLDPLQRVGINTLEPGFDLDVRGVDDVWDGGELQLATPGQTNILRFFSGRLGDHHPFMAFTDTDTFHIVSTAPDWSTYTRRMTVLPTGEFGIGIEDASGKLHIAHNSNGNSPQLFLTEEGYDYARIRMENTAKPGARWVIAGRPDSVLENSKLNFYYAGPEGTGDRMTILGNGDVGIGNTAPQARLDILGGDWNLGAGNPGDLRIGNSTYNLRIGVATGGGGAGVTRIFTGGGVSEMMFGTSDILRMTIKPDGKIGIGTGSPATLLHVGGTFRVDDLAGSGDRNVIVDGNGKFKIGTVGVGDTDWVETASQVSTDKEVYVDEPNAPHSSLTVVGRTSNGDNYAALGLWNYTTSPNLTFWRMLLDANDIDVFRGTSSPISETLSIQRQSSGDLHLVHGGGNIGIGVNAGGSRVTLIGPDNNGSVAGLEIRSSGSSQVLLIDGNEIDAASNLHLNANTGWPVSIGTLQIASGYKLSVAGKIIAEEVRVQLQAAWPDYVFRDDYHLTPLEELESVIARDGHLPGIPAATHLESQGLDVGEMQTKMMEKIEELTLYVIELNKQNKELQSRIRTLENSNRD